MIPLTAMTGAAVSTQRSGDAASYGWIRSRYVTVRSGHGVD